MYINKLIKIILNKKSFYTIDYTTDAIDKIIKLNFKIYILIEKLICVLYCRGL